MADLKTNATDWPKDYVHLLDLIKVHGAFRAPRGQPTVECRDFTILIEPSYNYVALLPTGIGRKLTLKIAAVEALQLCLGIELPELMHRVAPALSPFAEADGKFWGSYGARIGGQLLDCYTKLKADPDTRQAVVTLWNPALDGTGGKKDHPCTLNLVFSLIDGELELSVTMRSNDAWLGLPYDVFQFTQLQATLANLLEAPVGRYHHHAVSLHLYERDLPKLEDLHRHNGRYLTVPQGFNPPVDRGHGGLKMHAASVLWPHDNLERLTESELWYREQLT